jgi:uncharacterized peroxidase-related enzyme
MSFRSACSPLRPLGASPDGNTPAVRDLRRYELGELPARVVGRQPTSPDRATTIAMLNWTPWLEPLSAAEERPEHSAALEGDRGKSPYFRLLAHVRVLVERTATDRGIFYTPSGAPRHERELSAAATSRLNGCIYCTSVRPTGRAAEQTQRRDRSIARTGRPGTDLGFEPRWQAVTELAVALATPLKATSRHVNDCAVGFGAEILTWSRPRPSLPGQSPDADARRAVSQCFSWAFSVPDQASSRISSTRHARPGGRRRRAGLRRVLSPSTTWCSRRVDCHLPFPPGRLPSARGIRLGTAVVAPSNTRCAWPRTRRSSITRAWSTDLDRSGSSRRLRRLWDGPGDCARRRLGEDGSDPARCMASTVERGTVLQPPTLV